MPGTSTQLATGVRLIPERGPPSPAAASFPLAGWTGAGMLKSTVDRSRSDGGADNVGANDLHDALAELARYGSDRRGLLWELLDGQSARDAGRLRWERDADDPVSDRDRTRTEK